MKHFTELNLIVTKFRVDEYSTTGSRHGEEFTKVMSRWADEEWVKYLYEHGSIDKVDTYKEPVNYSTVYVLSWILDDRKKTIFLLKWADRLDKVYE